MNRRDKDIFLALSTVEYTGQRELARICDCSLGAVNGSVKLLLEKELIDKAMCPTWKGQELLQEGTPKRAVILAAGYGIRIPPLYAERPKALLEIDGETLIERTIRQLQEAGITEIHVVVGFAKEQFEFLIDRYGVDLIINSEYSRKNNLYSLSLARKYLHNCYVIPGDIYCRHNPYRRNELYSWYMVSDKETEESSVRVNRKQELTVVPFSAKGNAMIGISYLLEEDAEAIAARLSDMAMDRRYKGAFWEETLYEGDKFRIGPRLVSGDDVVEINSFEDLQGLDNASAELYMFPLEEIAKHLGARECEIKNIQPLKKGVTNRAYRFECGKRQYIMRIPGNRTDMVVDHNREADVYETIADTGLGEKVVYFDRATGFKISEYIDRSHLCDPENRHDCEKAMHKLRQFHKMGMAVSHSVDLFERIDYYESLWNGTASVYLDYRQTKEAVCSLRRYIDAQKKTYCLTHFDAVSENFLISDDTGDVSLIDWEYAAMQDPHVDIAMFCLYAMYDRQQVDELIDIYFQKECSTAVRLKIYCYISVCGLLWSNWCEYQIKRGVEFDTYAMKQYRFAKDYYRIVQKELNL